MFHVVYSRDYWNHDEPGQFTNTWTIYRNVSYFKLREMQKAIPSLLKMQMKFIVNIWLKIIKKFQIIISFVQKFM